MIIVTDKIVQKIGTHTPANCHYLMASANLMPDFTDPITHNDDHEKQMK